jgi:hypothetical protein
VVHHRLRPSGQQDLLQFYAAGASVRATAAHFDVSYGTAHRYIKDHGGVFRRRGAKPGKPRQRDTPKRGTTARSTLDWTIARSYIDDPATITEMAARHSVAETVVMHALDRHGVPRVKGVHQRRRAREAAEKRRQDDRQ